MLKQADRSPTLFESPEATANDLPEVRLVEGDSFKAIHDLPNGTIDLTMTSPPYNVGKEYETRKSIDDYLEPYQDFVKVLFDKTSESGSVCWQVGNLVQHGEVFPLDILFYPLFIQAGFQLRNRIVWHFGHGLHAQRRFSGRYETIMWFSKSAEYKFDLDAVRVPAKYPGKRAYKGANKGKPSGNPLGKNPSDIWMDIALKDWETSVWQIPNVKANHPEKTEHPCQFPVELVERCVLALTDPGDLILDPFLGVGSTAIGALKRGRRFLGIELDRGYIAVAKQRINSLEDGSIRLRPIGKPVHAPSGREKVAQRPDEWSTD